MKTPKFRARYSGLRLEGSEQRVSRGTGRREWWLSFYCACGELFATTLSVANQSHAKGCVMRCQTCQKSARVVREQRRQRKPDSPHTRTFSSGKPAITVAAIRLLQKYQKSPLYPRIVAMVAKFADAAMNEQIVPEWERIVVETVELVKLESKGVPLPQDWTRETIGDGLSRVSFPQYSVPADTSVS